MSTTTSLHIYSSLTSYAMLTFEWWSRLELKQGNYFRGHELTHGIEDQMEIKFAYMKHKFQILALNSCCHCAICIHSRDPAKRNLFKDFVHKTDIGITFRHATQL